MDLKRYNVGIVGCKNSNVDLFVKLLFNANELPPTDRGTSKQLVYQRVTPYKEVDVKVYFGYHPSGDISERAVDYDLILACYNSSDQSSAQFDLRGMSPDECYVLGLDMLPIITEPNTRSVLDRLKTIFLSLSMNKEDVEFVLA